MPACVAGPRDSRRRLGLLLLGFPVFGKQLPESTKRLRCKKFRTASQAGRVHVSDVYARCGVLLAISADSTPENYSFGFAITSAKRLG
jgi:hypothetical protein